MLSRSRAIKRQFFASRAPRQGSRRALIRELDRLTSLIVRKRDGHCLTCGATESLECSHFYKRRFHATRWDLTNCNAQCSRCNQLHNIKPFPYLLAIQERYGKDAIVELLALRDSYKRFTDDELTSLLIERRAMLKGM